MKHYQSKATTRGGKDFVFNVEQYDSALELYNTNRTRKVTDAWKGSNITESSISSSFHGVSSMEEAHKMLRDGWADKVDEMIALVNKAATVSINKRTAFKNDVVGFAPVVPLAMMNVPNSMLNTAVKPTKSKVIKICYLNDDNGGTSPETFLKRGKRVLEAIINLERNGYRCELYTAQFYVSGNRADSLLVRIKEANQPLDVKRVMFPMAHPAFLRVIGFEWEDKCPTNIYMSGRGRALHSTDDHERLFVEAFGSELVYIDKGIADKGTEAITKKLRGEA